MTTTEKRWYGVSTGDGNNGVSHIFPDYYVLTDDPWELAERASRSDVKEEFHYEIEIDGDEDYLISASVYDPEQEISGYILDVFPLGDDEIENGAPAKGYEVGNATSNGRAPMYRSIEDALGTE